MGKLSAEKYYSKSNDIPIILGNSVILGPQIKELILYFDYTIVNTIVINHWQSALVTQTDQ